MATKLEITTHGGISAIVDFTISVVPGKIFTLNLSGKPVQYMAVEYTGQPNRQCYKCAFCHCIDICAHFKCNQDKLIKFKEIKGGKQ